MEAIVYLNGEYLPASQAKVSVFDHSFLYGDGCFETIIVRQGRPFRLDEHITRLFRSATVLRIRIPLAPEALAAAVLETVRRNGFQDAYTRITLSRGEGYASADPRLAEKATLVIIAYDLGGHPAERFTSKGPGMRCIIASTRRTPPVCVEPRLKANNYLNQIFARMEAVAAGVDDAIMLDIANFVTETPSRNIFVVRDGKLLTPRAHNVLNGITREVVMDLAQKNGWPVAEADLTAYDLYTADEVLTTSTAGGIKAIVEVDGRPIGNGQKGPITRALGEQYEAMLVS